MSSSISFGEDLTKIDNICNGHLIDLHKFALKKGLKNDKIASMVSQMSEIPTANLNVKHLMTKINRVYKIDGSKRGEYKRLYREEPFIIPTCTATSSSQVSSTIKEPSVTTEEHKIIMADLAKELKEQTDKLEKTKVSLGDVKSKVGGLQEKNKQLKRKLIVREDYASITKKVKFLENKVKVSDKKLVSAKKQATNLRKNIIHLKKTNHVNLKKLSNTTKQLQQNDSVLERSIDENRKEQTVIAALEIEVSELKTSNDYLCSLINDETELVLFNPETKTFTPECVECVMNLTSFKVASQQVGPVIREVCKLCGKNPERVPSRSTVDNIVDRKSAVAHKQLGEVLKDKSFTTLYTDETRKYGRTVETYAVSDEEQNTYVLGLREMCNKSAISTLDTFKDILHDIDVHCKVMENNNKDSIGYQILVNIKNTMSDRASTEKSFNALLKQYRSEILPTVLSSWEDLSDDERSLCTSMNNFFCGLHLLVGMADVTESAILKFEQTYLDGKDVGSAVKPELKMFHKRESGTVRLLRTASKGFSMGGDEKNGVFSQWNTYLKSKSVKNSIVRFKHNRFNLIFLLGQCVYFHKEDIQEFLSNVHGTPNTLLRAILLDVQEPLYLAGVKCLGLIAKCISSPLWRKIEESGHILDMNDHFLKLLEFFEEQAKDASKFLSGDTDHYNTKPDEDPVLQKLLQSSELDAICLPELQCIFLSLHGLIKRMVADHLPGGKFFIPSQDLMKETRSAKKHNKLPEFIFGQLDHLMHYRPNASTLVNESFIMYNQNKTRKWLESLHEDERNRILEESRKEGREFRSKFQERLSEIETKRLEAQKKKKEENARLERNRIQKEANLTNDVCYYGLWQSKNEIDEGVARLESENMKRKGLESQLKFRKNVLRQKYADKKVFTFSAKQPNGKYAKHSLETLSSNLLLLVQDAMGGIRSETVTPDVPLFVGKTIDHTFADGTVYRGKVICTVPGFPSWYNVSYENDEALYVYNLMDDYKKGDVKLVIHS